MSTQANLDQVSTLIKYTLLSKPASAWLLPAAFCLFVFGVFWRLCLNGQQDSLFFQALSLGYCWYIYVASVLVTIYGLRKNTGCFYIDKLKKFSFFVGLFFSFIVYLFTFIFLVEIDAAGFMVVLMYPLLFLMLNNNWRKWRDVSRLSMTGFFPFFLINSFIRMSPLLTASVIWEIISLLIAIVAIVAIVAFIADSYKSWMNKPRNFNQRSDDYAVTQHYYQKRK